MSVEAPGTNALARPSSDRTWWVTYGVLVIVTGMAWVSMIRAAMRHDMAGMQMIMAPTFADAAAYVAAWAVMMTAMMLPSAAPMIALYAATQRHVPRAGARSLAVSAFAVAYLVLWAATGLPAYFAGLALMALSEIALAYVTGTVLVVAGAFQWTPLKRVCLRHCRSPIGFLLGHWRAGLRGALAMGWEHAWYCVGCCWALMGVLVVAGAMGLPWVLLIGSLVAAEKLLPGGERIARAIGVLLVVLGVAMTIRPELAMTLRGLG
jgi:predicted metal-binding membrane protein